MNLEPFFFELSGEHPDLPKAEVLSVIEAECDEWRERFFAPGLLIAEFERERLTAVASRLALCHRAGGYLGSCPLDKVVNFAEELEIPEGTIAVRAKRFQGNMLPMGPSEIARKVGGILARDRRVDLEGPDVEIRILISGEVHFFVGEETIDRPQFERRKVSLRPFFSPISLHPKYARALVNLTGVKRGQRLLDPFCGTGGILIEASLMGIRAIGSDISEGMVRGCLENMEFFGADHEALRTGDVGEIREMFGEVDAIATDPPYGRSTTTMRERLGDLYHRMMVSFTGALPPSGKVGMVLPTPCATAAGLTLIDRHVQRVHKSLTRHYCVLARESDIT